MGVCIAWGQNWCITLCTLQYVLLWTLQQLSHHISLLPPAPHRWAQWGWAEVSANQGFWISARHKLALRTNSHQVPFLLGVFPVSYLGGNEPRELVWTHEALTICAVTSWSPGRGGSRCDWRWCANRLKFLHVRANIHANTLTLNKRWIRIKSTVCCEVKKWTDIFRRRRGN